MWVILISIKPHGTFGMRALIYFACNVCFTFYLPVTQNTINLTLQACDKVSYFGLKFTHECGQLSYLKKTSALLGITCY